MNAKFAVEVVRGRRVATLTVRTDDDAIETAMAAAVARFKAECARHGVAVASASTVETQLSLFGEHADVTVAEFVTGAARKSAGSARRRSRRAA